MLVDPNENPYSLSGIFAMGSFNPSDTARVVLVDPDGNPYKATGGSGGGATIQVNGVDTSDQTLLNFVDTASVTWANPSGGIVEATATGGGGSGTVTQVNTTAPITGGPITTTGTIGITQASASVNGFLSSTDWNTFNNKVGGPAGADGDIQFNNGGVFGGDSKVIRYTVGGNKTFLSTNDTVESGLDMTVNNVTAFIMSAKNIYGGTNKDLAIANDPLGTYGLLINGDTNEVEIRNHLLVDQTIPVMTGLPSDFRLAFIHPSVTATDGVATQAINSLVSQMEIGPSGEAVQGNFHAITSAVEINGSGNDSSEYTSWLGLVNNRIGTGYTQTTGPAGRVWGSDWTVQGPIAVQPNLLNGLTQFVGNYYNGSPSSSLAGGIWIATAPNGGAAGTEGARNGATTYPVDVGLGITGASGTVGTPSGLGFTTAIQIGGNGSGWWESGQTRIGTGINIRDFTTRGIYVNNPIGTPTADIETTGKVIVGGNLTNSVLTASELVGTDASKNLTSVAVGTGLSLSGGTLTATGGSGTVVFQNPGLRLTLTTGVPVTTSDVTAAGTLYWTPMFSGNVWYWDGAAWQVETITEQSLALTLTSGKNYDVFYLHGTGLVLSSAWTNDTTRADALGTQNGVTVLSSDHTKLWIGTIRASGTNVTEDSGGGTTTQVGGKRFVYNTYNQVRRDIKVIDTTDAWAYRTGTWRQENGASGNKTEYVSGSAAASVSATYFQTVALLANTARAAVGIGVDSTSTPSGFVEAGFNGNATNYIISAVSAGYSGFPGLGYHAVYPLEFGATDAGSGDCQFTGDNGTTQQTGFVAYLNM